MTVGVAKTQGRRRIESSVSGRGLTWVLAGLLLGVLLSACGGGGGGSGAPPVPTPPPVPQTITISGTVAAGASLTGTVSVYDSSANAQPRTASTAIGAAGQYSVVVTGFTPPFLLQATGQVGGQGPTVTFYSVASAAGTVNITPVTSLMALNMAAGNIQTLMKGSAGILPSLTVTDLNDQNANMDILLSAVLTQEGLSANYNFSTTAFTVGDAGYSQLLNAVTFDLVNPAAVTITDNSAPGTPITVDTETGSPNGPLDVVNGPATLPIAYVTVTIGGTVTGLSASGLQLQNNGGDTISVASNATTFTFATAIASGAAYVVTVKTQPSGQSCAVANGTGTAASANVNNVTLACTTNAVPTYTFGGTISNLKGVTLNLILKNDRGYASNVVAVLPGQSTFSFGIGLPDGTGYNTTVQQQPSGQSCSVTNGSGTVSGSNVASINISCATVAQWAWISGDDSALNTVYGTLGQAASANSPGGRSHAASSVDAAGNLWLFGGGYSDNSLANDLWMYNPNTGQWTWAAGSSVSKAAGVYGTKGVSASTSVPGARYGAVSWTDTAGNFWLFGGQGYDSMGTQSWLNDLWKFSSASGQWVWVSGSSLGNASGAYGTAGVAAASNQPGARLQAFGWIDSANNLWLQGGAGINASGHQTTLNDLWKFDVAAGRWTWINGSQVGAVAGVYGTKSVPNAANFPGARQAAATWTDNAGQFWLFGGNGLDASGTSDDLSDLWRYSPASGLWTWMGGSTSNDVLGVYGVQGVAAASNMPGARFAATSWVDGDGAFWLLGGEGYDSSNYNSNIQNDVWRYDSASGEWTWIAGANADGGGSPGRYLVQGLPDAGNSPGARTSGMSWMDGAGVWLYGGVAASPLKPGAPSYTLSQGANDVWHLGPAIFYNGTGSMSGTFTDQSGCQYTAVATIVNANVTMSTQSAGAVTITFAVPAFTAQASSAPSCPTYQAFNGSFAVPVSVNGTVMQSLPGSVASVNATLSDGIVSGAVGFQETGAQGSGTFTWTESGSFSTPAVSVTVPNLIGATQAVATAAINTAGLRVGTITRQNSDTVPTGNVISQMPVANSTVVSGSSVSLAISTGPASETVPNVVGLSQAAADSAIIAAGLSLGTVTQQNDATISSGSVISETPVAGVKASAGSAVTLVISRGPLFVAVPDVVGLSQSDATTAIKGAGLIVGNVSVQASTTTPSGSVLSETPTANTSVVSSTAVNIVVSSVSSPVSVPNVVGVDQATAVSAITGAGLTVGPVTLQMSATVPAGTVISETPSASSGVRSGGAVGLVVSLGADQGIWLPVASPDAIQPGNPTTITVHSNIDLPNLVASSVTVRQVNLAGSALGSLGQLNDLGTNGDLTAADGVYSGTITLSPAAAGRIWLQVVANETGTSNQVVSDPIPIDILPAGMPFDVFVSDLSQLDTDALTGNPTARDEIFACFKPEATPAGAVSTAALVGARIVGYVSAATNCYQLLLPAGSGAALVSQTANLLKGQPLVMTARPEFVHSVSGSTCAFCSDTSYKLLGFDKLNVTAKLAPAIALLDTGADFNGQGDPRLKMGKNCLNPSASPQEDSTNRHGSLMTSILTSADPLSDIYVIKVADRDGHWEDPWLECGIKDASRQDVRVMNLSLDDSGSDGFGNVDTIIEIQNFLDGGKKVMVVAAGNEKGTSPDFPASLSANDKRVISVSAVNDSGVSETGDGSTVLRDFAYRFSNLRASITGPGVLTDSNGSPIDQGTSIAAPFVSATAALVMAQYPTLDAAGVKAQVLSSAVPIYYLDSNFAIIDQHLVNPSEGGKGRLDPVAALGGIRFTHSGFVDGNELDVTLAAAGLISEPVILGTAGPIPGDLNPADLICEARVSDSCTFDLPMAPLPLGQYQINLSVPAGSDNDFGGSFTVTVPGLKVINCLTPASGSVSVDGQTGSINLIGLNGQRRFAIFTLQQSAP
jgi:beta-lactam-binding protein with PASTA domain/N-acetylneuraminic acid mutarotase